MSSGHENYYQAMGAALLTAAHCWIRGELDRPKPDVEEGVRVINYLTETAMLTTDHCWVPGALQDLYPHSEQIQNFVKILIEEKPDISVHFQQVAAHRRWVQHAYTLWRECIPDGDEDVKMLAHDLYRRVKIHDLSKYGPYEALGYHYKFGKDSPMEPLSEEDKEWARALSHHYCHNDHHPEYFTPNPRGDNTTRCMSLRGLVESVLDMVACRLARTLKQQNRLCPAQILAIPGNYLERYFSGSDGGDYNRIVTMLVEWADRLDELLASRLVYPMPVLDAWERATGFKLDEGKWAKIGAVEMATGFKILDSGDYVNINCWEEKTAYRNEAGDWVKDWQNYLLWAKSKK